MINSKRTHFVLPLLGLLAGLVAACSSGPKGDVVHGEELYAQCLGCHTMRENNEGPMHCGVFGRPAGSVAGFEYSEAMINSGIVWDEKILDEFLTSPFAYVNGTKMGFVGFNDATDRQDLIAYLYQQTSDSSVCP